MRIVLLVAFVWAALATARGDLGQSQAQIEQRWGAPTRIRGYPDERTYRYSTGRFRVDVTYLHGKSASENYWPLEKTAPISPAEVDQLLALNSLGQNWQADGKDYQLPERAARAYLEQDASGITNAYFVTKEDTSWRVNKPPIVRTGHRETLSGKVTLRTVGNAEWITVHSGARVLEMAWAIRNYHEPFAVLRAGETYDFILRDAEGLDIETRVANLSDREHKDWEDLVYDSRQYLLDRVQQGDVVLFDRTVCEVHRCKMIVKQVEIVYGLVGMNACDERFPHHRDYILGGCVVGEQKTGWLYLCPKCMAGCADYHRAHPEQIR